MSADSGAELLLPELASALLRVFPPLDESGRRIALQIYRDLAGLTIYAAYGSK